MLESIYRDRTNDLLSELENALNSNFHTYRMTKEIKSCGVYIIYDNKDKIIYVGETTRTISRRLSELKSGGHTMHKKLLEKSLKKLLNMPDFRLKDKTKMIEDKILSEKELEKCREDIKTKVTNDFKYKVYIVEQARLAEVEHFFIAILNPKYND